MTTPMPAAFGAIAKQLYGDAVDPRELWELTKNAPDTADVHTDGQPQKKPSGGHKKVGGLLLLGTAAEADAAVHAGQSAAKTVRSAASIGAKAGSVGRAGLQGANLGIGLIAARQLMKKPKPIPKQPVAKGLRTKKVVMSPEQAAAIKDSLHAGGTAGVRLVAGAALVGGAAIGHHLGVKRGRQQAAVAKAFRVKPLNPANAPRVVTLKARKPPMAPPLSKSSIGLHSPAEVENLTGLHAQHVRDSKRFGLMDAPNPVKVSRMRHERSTSGPAGRGTVTEVVSSHWSAKGGARRPKVRLITRGIAKSLSWSGEISKVDEDKHLVFGWCSLSSVDGKPVVDLQGDFVPLEEIEKSAYKYVIESRKGGDMHKRVSKLESDEPLHTADMVESFVVTPEKLAGMGLAEDALPHGWWVGFKVNDEAQWAMVKSGERAGFSIHGTGQRRAA